MRKTTFFLFLISITFIKIEAQELLRRATWQAQVAYPAAEVPGATVRSVEAGSPLDKAGVKAGDIILSVNGQLATNARWSDIDYALRGGVDTELIVKSGVNSRKVILKLNPLEEETHDGFDTSYEQFTTRYGITQRAIITKPKNKRGRQPAMFMIGGLSCSSMEVYSKRGGNWPKVIRALVEETGMVVMRIEKPGVGDSQGACSQTDFYTELEGIREGIRMLKSKDYVDTTNIIVFGSSMGSAIAPSMANEFGLAGVISDGTFFKTWYEHMLEIERRIKQMEGHNESEISKMMNEAYIPLYHGMLIQKKTYQQVVDEYPAIAEYNYHGADQMYGRPVAYYQQLQQFDFAAGWENLQVPLRIMRGTNDWIMSAYDNQMIIDLLNRKGHKDHQLYEYPGLDHWNTIHPSPENSYFGRPGKWEDEISGILVKWARELAGVD